MASDVGSSTTRRAMLASVGAGLGSTAIGGIARGQREPDSGYTLVQGDQCVSVRPLSGSDPVRDVYEYRLPERYVSEENGAFPGDEITYASAGTTPVQRARTSVLFLYRGPEELSLVVVHGSLDASDAGSVTFRFGGLPEGGSWVVKDDLYRDPETGRLASHNYDRWDDDGTEHRIDWTWGSAGTDGGAFSPLGGDFQVVVDPAFNDAAALHDEFYRGTVTDWEFVTGTADGFERLSLSMDEPIGIATGRCDDEPDDGDEAADGADDGGRRAVCHRPPGNPDNRRTIRVGSESAVQSHLEHGDTRGPCPSDG